MKNNILSNIKILESIIKIVTKCHEPENQHHLQTNIINKLLLNYIISF